MLKKFSQPFRVVLLMASVAVAAICFVPPLTTVWAEELSALQIMEKGGYGK